MKLSKPFYSTICKDSTDGIKTPLKRCINPIGTIFVGKDSIKNLDLSFLHHWERINFTHIRDCKRLKRVVYPSSLKEVSGGLLMNCYDVEEIVILSKDWKSHTNLTHPGKYFRPSKVKIMRPTSPK